MMLVEQTPGSRWTWADMAMSWSSAHREPTRRIDCWLEGTFRNSIYGVQYHFTARPAKSAWKQKEDLALTAGRREE